MKLFPIVGALCLSTTLAGCMTLTPDTKPKTPSSPSQAAQTPFSTPSALAPAVTETTPISYSFMYAERALGQQDLLSSDAKRLFGDRFKQDKASTGGTHSQESWLVKSTSPSDVETLKTLFEGIRIVHTSGTVVHPPAAAEIEAGRTFQTQAGEVTEENTAVIVGFHDRGRLQTHLSYTTLLSGAGHDDEGMKIDGNMISDAGDMLVFSWSDYTDAIDPTKGKETLLIVRPTIQESSPATE